MLSQLPKPGDVIANRYRVDAVLGHGGMGAAYAATNLVTGKQVALKWVLRERTASRLRRIIREARAASRVRHPNIVDVYDVGEHEGSLFLVMELLSGQSLQAAIDRQAPLPLDQVLRWLLPVLRGVRALHRHGVIHRDLKPANIFLSQDESGGPISAKVLDFGVSKLVSSTGDDEEPSLTDSGSLIGTPSYMAPEQLQEARSVDARADVYSCGAILYHALAGRRPFEAEGYPKLVMDILTTTPTALATLRRDLPGALCDAIHRALQREPELRLPDMDALIAAVEPFAQESDAPAGASTSPRSLGLSGQRSGKWVGLALAVAAALGLLWAADLVRPLQADSPRPAARQERAAARAPAIRVPVPDVREPAPVPVPTAVEATASPAPVPAPTAKHKVDRPKSRSARAVRAAPSAEPIIELGRDEF